MFFYLSRVRKMLYSFVSSALSGTSSKFILCSSAGPAAFSDNRQTSKSSPPDPFWARPTMEKPYRRRQCRAACIHRTYRSLWARPIRAFRLLLCNTAQRSKDACSNWWCSLEASWRISIRQRPGTDLFWNAPTRKSRNSHAIHNEMLHRLCRFDSWNRRRSERAITSIIISWRPSSRACKGINMLIDCAINVEIVLCLSQFMRTNLINIPNASITIWLAYLISRQGNEYRHLGDRAWTGTRLGKYVGFYSRKFLS